MSKKPRIKNREKAAIGMAYGDHPKEKAEYIRQEASKICGRDLSLSTVQKELVHLRKEYPKGMITELEAEWSLASLTDCPVLEKAVPLLLYINATFHDNMKEGLEDAIEIYQTKLFLSIRTARWISRLLLIPDEAEPPNNITGISRELPRVSDSPKWPEWVDDLVYIALAYSRLEKGCELYKIIPNSLQFDAPTISEIRRRILQYYRKRNKNT